ncbi:MAG: class I SAM-dependent methyltransferase [Halobacteriota archaeon]
MNRRRGWSFLWEFIDLYRIKYALKYVDRGSVLDIGAGDAIEFIPREKYDYYCGIDLDKKLMEYLQQKHPDCDFFALDLDKGELNLNKKFDTILMLALIEHIHNPEKLLMECYKHLKRGGKLIITTPTKRGDRLLKILVKFFGSKESDESKYLRPHCTIYNRKGLESALKNAGFGVCVYKNFQFGMNQIAVAEKVQVDE